MAPVAEDEYYWTTEGLFHDPDHHAHRHSGQKIAHTHENGRLKHGYYDHPEDTKA